MFALVVKDRVRLQKQIFWFCADCSVQPNSLEEMLLRPWKKPEIPAFHLHLLPVSVSMNVGEFKSKYMSYVLFCFKLWIIQVMVKSALLLIDILKCLRPNGIFKTFHIFCDFHCKFLWLRLLNHFSVLCWTRWNY